MEAVMKSKSIPLAILIAIAANSLVSAPVDAATKPKAAGRTSSSIANTILNGKGAPLNSLGIVGDFYIDTRSLLIYGPKSKTKWPLPQSLQGPTGEVGASGVNGKNGAEGKTVSSASNTSGPIGLQGEKGEKGAKGDTGESGLTGSSGSQGSAGATGAKGDTGAAGTNGSNGTNGAAGTNGSNGLVGAKGETGTAGAAGANGTSNLYLTTIPSWTLSTSTKRTFSTSTILTKFKANKSYIYTIYLTGVSDANNAIFEINIIHEDSTASTFNYLTSMSEGFESDPKLYRYNFMITGTITLTGSDVGIAIKVIDDKGLTGPNPLTITGRMYSTLVGTVGTL